MFCVGTYTPLLCKILKNCFVYMVREKESIFVSAFAVTLAAVSQDSPLYYFLPLIQLDARLNKIMKSTYVRFKCFSFP